MQLKREAVERGKLLRFIMTKFRQWGGSTQEISISDYITGTMRGQYALTMAHDFPSTAKIFEIANRMYDMQAQPHLCIPGTRKPLFHWERARRNKRELYYPEADGTHFIGTAGNTNFGHGLTINRAHLSEAARFPDLDSTLAALEGVPRDGEIILESTPHGAVGPYYELNQEAFRDPKFEWTLLFFTWYELGFEDYQRPCDNDDERQTILAEVANGSHPRFGNEEQALAQRLASEGIVLTPEQWKWRRWKRGTLKGRFFEQYPEDFVSCWLASGRPFFDLISVMGPTPEGWPAKVIAEHEGGSLWVYEDPKPGREYVLGADVAEGIERGLDKGDALDPITAANAGITDLSSFFIVDRETRQDVAAFIARVEVGEYSRILDRWGRAYNDAVAAVERNNHGHAVLLSLRDVYHYPNVYAHVDRMKDDGNEDLRPGFPTDKVTRPTMLDDLDMEIREGIYFPTDLRLKEQMKTFVVNAKGKAEAGDGYHDDMVIARAIAGYVCRLPENHTFSMIV